MILTFSSRSGFLCPDLDWPSITGHLFKPCFPCFLWNLMIKMTPNTRLSCEIQVFAWHICVFCSSDVGCLPRIHVFERKFHSRWSHLGVWENCGIAVQLVEVDPSCKLLINWDLLLVPSASCYFLLHREQAHTDTITTHSTASLPRP